MSVVADVQYDLNPGITADVNAAVAGVVGLRLAGFSVRFTAAGNINIVHGATAGGDLVVAVQGAVDTTHNQWYGEAGIPMANGISINVLAGTADVTLLYRTLP